MDKSNRIRTIKVTGLQGQFDYELEFQPFSNLLIIIAPNGYGKTALLSLVNSCLQFQLARAAEQIFDTLEVVFDNNSKWLFTRTEGAIETKASLDTYPKSARHRMSRRHSASIEVKFYDEKGKIKKHTKLPLEREIPREILARALESVLPLERETYDTFMDMRTGEILKISEAVEKYYPLLQRHSSFTEMIGPYAKNLFLGYEKPINCVFIETQRLLLTRRPSRLDAEKNKEPEEEIDRQAQSLATMLKNTHSNYAGISQDLDRSFPNRLIARAGDNTSRIPDVAMLRQELDAIEAKRVALTQTGILFETREPILPPKDELITRVADTLEIYVEDSKKKLAALDDLYEKVSVFKELLSKKYRPKELLINREIGAEIKRGDKRLRLASLSSGEKHEFIMLFRLIFETPSNSIVLIDEPEISLHVIWQLEFLGDLQRIQNVNDFQSIIATHSPQIIQGASDITIDLADQAP